MIKKLLVTVLLALCVVLPTFASENWIGVSTGGDFSFGENTIGSDETEYSTFNVPLQASGMSFFGEDSSVGLSYNVGLSFPISRTEDGEKVDTSDNPSSFVASAGPVFRISNSGAMDLLVGAGFRLASTTWSNDLGEIKTTLIGVYGDVAIASNMNKNIVMVAGAKLGFNYSKKMEVTLLGFTNTIEGENSEFIVNPYMGVYYKF